MTDVIANRKNAYFRLRMTNGEQVMVGFTNSSFRISEMGYFGMWPKRTIVEWPASEADDAFEVFEDKNAPVDTLWDAVRTRLLVCDSIQDIEALCAKRSKKKKSK